MRKKSTDPKTNLKWRELHNIVNEMKEELLSIKSEAREANLGDNHRKRRGKRKSIILVILKDDEEKESYQKLMILEEEKEVVSRARERELEDKIGFIKRKRQRTTNQMDEEMKVEDEKYESEEDREEITIELQFLTLSNLSIAYLLKIQPCMIVFFEFDLGSLRKIEWYISLLLDKQKQREENCEEKRINPNENGNVDILLKVSILIYENTIQEDEIFSQKILEYNAFSSLYFISEKLFNENYSSISSNNNISSSSTSMDLSTIPFFSSSSPSSSSFSKVTEMNVMVDIREFSSNLPFVLYSFSSKSSSNSLIYNPDQSTSHYNFHILPHQLIVGDYILNGDIGIERKGISDLIQSFNSGRLFNQVFLL